MTRGATPLPLAFADGSGYRSAMSRNVLRIGGALGFAAAIVALSPPATAAKPKKEPAQSASSMSETSKTETLGSAGPWSAFASRDKTGRVCYLVGQPQKADSGVARKPPQAMVTHRPTENISNVVSFVEGYPLKEGSDVELEIGDKKFDLFTKDDSAWARTADLDRTIVATLAKGSSAVVKGTPQKGKATADTYTLAGFAKALALIDKACGIKRAETPAQHPRKKVRHPKH
jgi:hypothetical protein